MNLENICLQTIELSKEVGKFISSNVNNISSDIVEVKSENSFVTYVDTNAEKKLVEGLSKIIPSAGFITEEETINKKSEKYNWIIDPLDGTTNYIHGLPPYSISIGLMEGRQIILGMVLEICLDECFYAWKNGDAYLNGEKIIVSKVTTLGDSLFATGFPYCAFNRLDEYMKLFVELMKKSQGLRRLGSAAVDMAYVACGRFEGFFEYGLNPWDVAAGAVIIQQAGGKVSDFDGGDNYIFGEEIIATNNYIYEDFLKLVGKHMCPK